MSITMFTSENEPKPEIKEPPTGQDVVVEDVPESEDIVEDDDDEEDDDTDKDDDEDA